jgi:hypothetical protein
MAHYDKYDPYDGGFRARLAAAWAAADGIPVGVGLDVNGRVVPGAGNTGIKGIVILIKNHKNAGDTIDVMTDGQIVELTGTPAVAGSNVYADNVTGALGVTGGAGKTYVGHTVEADRLEVRVARA